MSNIVQRNLTLPVPRFSAAELQQQLGLYREMTAQPTWAGSAAFLGVTRAMLDACLNGQIAHPEKDAIIEAIQIHKTHLEAFLETVLTREKGSPAGAQFALKNQHGWSETIGVELSAKPALSIIVEGGLGRLLMRRDEADAVDGEVIEDDDSWLE